MDQQKAGRFLKELRHEKQMTQEQLAQVFHVSSRTISRWENGTNLPDISLLVEIADFYDVDVREIIEGERKSEMMDKEVREVATKMADYASEEKSKLLKGIQIVSFIGVLILLVSILLQTAKQTSINYGVLIATLLALVIMAIIIPFIATDLKKTLSLAGVFALVRFRSIPGDSKDILFVFFSLSVGLIIGLNDWMRQIRKIRITKPVQTQNGTKQKKSETAVYLKQEKRKPKTFRKKRVYLMLLPKQSKKNMRNRSRQLIRTRDRM